MKDLSGLDILLQQIGPLSLQAREETLLRERNTAPKFRALSFFRTGEVKATKILAYFLTPTARHGQSSKFLELFLHTLGLDIETNTLHSVSVVTDAPCYTIPTVRYGQFNSPTILPMDTTSTHERPGYPIMDILIRFRVGRVDYVVMVESKSHNAPDQRNQVRDYLTHIECAYSRCKKYLFYLKDGKPPDKISISPSDWNRAEAEGVCYAKPYATVISEWMKASHDISPLRLQSFYTDFAAFLDLEEDDFMPIDKRIVAKVGDILNAEIEGENLGSDVLEALLQIYEMHESIRLQAISICFERAARELRAHHKEWRIVVTQYLDSGSPYVEMRLCKAAWQDRLWIYLGSEDEANPPYHLDLCIQKHPDFSTQTSCEFKDNKLRIGTLKRDEYIRRPLLVSVGDLSSATGVRALLTDQAVKEIVTEIDILIGEYELLLDSCFIVS